MKLMFHDDDCGELLNSAGSCPKCKFHPDMQSTGFREVAPETLKPGRAYLGLHRQAVRALPTGSVDR